MTEAGVTDDSKFKYAIFLWFMCNIIILIDPLCTDFVGLWARRLKFKEQVDLYTYCIQQCVLWKSSYSMYKKKEENVHFKNLSLLYRVVSPSWSKWWVAIASATKQGQEHKETLLLVVFLKYFHDHFEGSVIKSLRLILCFIKIFKADHRKTTDMVFTTELCWNEWTANNS